MSLVVGNNVTQQLYTVNAPCVKQVASLIPYDVMSHDQTYIITW